MTELVARRLAPVLGVSMEWLMGTSSSEPASRLRAAVGSRLPVFAHPIEGDPQAHPKWYGEFVEVAGAAAAQAVSAKLPYVLRFDNDDVQGRLQRSDLILISQAVNSKAAISVVRRGSKLFLARPNAGGSWTRVANGSVLAEASPIVGHCLGVIWSPMTFEVE